MRWIPLIALCACEPTLAPPLAEADTDVDTDTDSDTDVEIPATLPPPSPLDDPEGRGPQSVSLEIVELDVGNELPLRLRVHTPSTPDTRVALVLTGFSLAPDLYDSYSQHLASHGYVSIGVGLRTNAFTPRTHASLAAEVSQVIDWIEDQTSGPLAAVDTSRVVIAGHSLGGKLALMAALEDSRVYGVVGIDPVDGVPPGVEISPDNPSVTPERMGDFDFPMVFVGEDADSTRCAPQAENYRAYYDATTAPVVRIEITDANHVSFLDNPTCGFLCNLCAEPSDDPEVTKAITAGIVYAYFEHVLRNREGARQYLITMPGHAAAGRASVNVKNGF